MMHLAIAVGAAALCLVPLTASAQAPGARAAVVARADRPVRVGLALGLTRANVSGADAPNQVFDSKLGAVFGATLRYRLSDAIAIQPELLYAMKGTRIDLGGLGVSSALSFDYIAVPLLVHTRIPTGADATPFIQAGPSLGFLVRAVLDEGGMSEDVSDQIGELDVGVVIGGGVEVATARGTVVLAIRYELGVTDVSEDLDDGDVNNRALTLGVGFVF